MSLKSIVAGLLGICFVFMSGYLLIDYTPLSVLTAEATSEVISRLISSDDIVTIVTNTATFVWTARGFDVLIQGFIFLIAVAGAVGLLKTKGGSK